MFDRRVKIFLGILVLLTVVLLLRVTQVQLAGAAHWEQEAIEMMKVGELVETTRGRLLDRNGEALAVDAPCIDAAVDYRAILFEPEKTWVRQVAIGRVRARLGERYPKSRVERDALIEEETAVVLGDIRAMWDQLARAAGMTLEEMDSLRASIIRKVDIRRRTVWYARYQRALDKQSGVAPPPWYQRWIMDESAQAPELDQFHELIYEEREAHVILPDIPNAIINLLGKNQARYPGLELRESLHRTYPWGEVGAHLVGSLRKVQREDINPETNARDELRGYQLNDLIGRSGLEALAEPHLRGTRGRIERLYIDAPQEVKRVDPIPGKDVLATIDRELQRDIHQIFSRVELTYDDNKPPEVLAMPGAAVVIDVKTNQVLSLVSYPSFNPNEFDQLYSQWVRDEINRPMMNRATQFRVEPGSTVKPIVGLGAMTRGLIGVHDTIECTGNLIINGRKYSVGRCWTMSAYGHGHHDIPTDAAHPTGWLTYSDALERSCNVYFETLADRMGFSDLRYWYDRFGLGRPTGLGIAEVSGLIPGDTRLEGGRIRSATWFSGIGQDQVLATPIQMANIASTLARGGIWMRPRLLMDDNLNPMTTADKGPEKVDLKLSPEGLAAMKEGMIKVVHSGAGTGTAMRLEHLVVAGKTGSAQAGPLMIPAMDESGERRKVPLAMGTHEQPNPTAPWYRGWGPNQDRRSHAWVIGFVPAENPKLAFSVMVEYGGGGGKTAAWVAHEVLEACIERGYLPKK